MVNRDRMPLNFQFNRGERISKGLHAVRMIGEGGLSEIWLAEDGSEPVALKIFKIDSSFVFLNAKDEHIGSDHQQLQGSLIFHIFASQGTSVSNEDQVRVQLWIFIFFKILI